MACIGVALTFAIQWSLLQPAGIATGDTQSYPAIVHSIGPEPPDCVLRNSPLLADRLLELTGEGFSTTEHNLQFRKVATDELSIHFHSEINWESETRITVDMERLKDMLWNDSKVTLAARLTTYTGSSYEPVSDWSPQFILADDTAACNVPDPTPTPTPTPPPDSGLVNVYVLNFDPLIDGQPLTQYRNWNEPDDLMADYVADVSESSGEVVTCRLAKQSVIRTYPTKPGGFVFTNEQYLACLSNPDTATRCRDIIDYQAVLNTPYDPDYVSACEALAAREIDEIWLWGGPWFGYWEYHTVQPATLCADVNRRFTVMGFSYERGVAEMLHDLGHRAEHVLQGELGLTLWDQFDGQRPRYAQDYACPAAPDATHPEVEPGDTHCGDVHFPPNAYCHYQYDRDLAVQSNCDDWLNYPDLTGQKTTVNAADWGSDQRGFLKWWLGRLPRNPGSHDGLYNNWWKYIFPLRPPPKIHLPLVCKGRE